MNHIKDGLPFSGRKVVVKCGDRTYWAVWMDNQWNIGNELPQKSTIISMRPNPKVANMITHWEYKVIV